jgi:hypothetical protein
MDYDHENESLIRLFRTLGATIIEVDREGRVKAEFGESAYASIPYTNVPQNPLLPPPAPPYYTTASPNADFTPLYYDDLSR